MKRNFDHTPGKRLFMKYRALALLLFIFAFFNANAAVILQMDMGFFLASPATNRTITLNAQSPFPGNTLYAYSDTNGIAYFTNCPSGLINGVILAPPGRITFQVNILAADSGLINASNRLASGSSTTYPAGQVAWAIATSDTRYQLSGTTLSNTFYPLYSNPSNYLTLATDPKQTNGFTTIVFSNPAAFLPVSGTNGLIGFLQASNVAFYIYTNNPSNYVNQTQLTAATNGLITAGATNGLATTNFVLSTASTVSNVLSSRITTTSNVLASGIIGATNGIKSTAYSNSTAFILTNALPNLTNGFYPLSNPSNYISGFTNTATATNISGDALLQVTNIAFYVYTNNSSGYVQAGITNGLAGTNYVWQASATTSNALVATGLNISNAITANLSASNSQIQANISATNTAEVARVTAQIALTNTSIRSAFILTNSANLVITTNLFGVSTNYANTNAMRLIAASNAVVLITVSNNLANATNGFVINTNGTATSLTLASNAYFGSPVSQTLQLNGTPYFGLTGAGNTGVNGTYGKETSSIWTNFLNPNYTVILSGGIYYAQSNSVSLYAFTSLPSTNGTIVSPGINPVPAFTLGWTFNLNGGVFNGQFNSTNATSKTIGLIAQYAVTNNSYQQITFYNTNNVYYGTFVGTNAVNATNATYLGGLYYTNYVTFGSIGGGYLTNNNNIVISGELQGSGTTNIILNPTATFTNDVNSLASTLITVATNAIDSAKLYGTISNARLSSTVITNGRPNVRLGGMNLTDWTTYQTIQPSNSISYIQFQNSALINLSVEGGDGVIDEGFFAATNGSIFLQTYNLVNSGLEVLNLGTNGILSLSNAVYSGSGSGLTNLLHSSTVSAGANVTVTPTQNPDGSTNYAIASSGGSVTYPFAATTATNAQQAAIAGVATNGATVSVDASMTVTPTVNANGTTNYLLTSVAGGGSATNAIALTNGIGYQTTLNAAKSITVTNIVTTNITAFAGKQLDIRGVSSGGSGFPATISISPQVATTSPGAHGSIFLQPGGADGTGFIYGTNFIGRYFNFPSLASFNQFYGENTFEHQYGNLPLQTLSPDYSDTTGLTNIWQINTNGVPIVYVDRFDRLHAPMDATNLFNAGVLTNGFVTISAVTNGSVIPANVVTNAIYLTTSTASGTVSITSNTLAITTFATLPSGLVTNNGTAPFTNTIGIKGPSTFAVDSSGNLTVPNITVTGNAQNAALKMSNPGVNTTPQLVGWDTNTFYFSTNVANVVLPGTTTVSNLVVTGTTTGISGGGSTNVIPYFNVKTWGATGDGVTDDTAAILNTLHAAAANGGGTVYFPMGIYTNAGGFYITNNIKILMDGVQPDSDGTGSLTNIQAAAARLVYNNAGGFLFCFSNTSGGMIEGGAMVNLNPNCASGEVVTCVHTNWNQKIDFLNTFISGGYDGVQWHNNSSSTMFNCTIENQRHDSFLIENLVNADAGDMKVIGNNFIARNYKAATAVHQMSSGGLIFIGNKINCANSNYTNGFYAEINASTTGLTFNDNNAEGMLSQGFVTSSPNGSSCNAMTVNGNHIVSCGSYAISLNDNVGSGSTISGNAVEGTQGIQLGNMAGVFISANMKGTSPATITYGGSHTSIYTNSYGLVP